MHPFDRVTVDGKTIGVSTWIGYTANEGKMLTLAVLDAEYAEPGTEVDFRLGRGKWRFGKTDGRAAHANAHARHRQPRALCRSGAQILRPRRVAIGARLTEIAAAKMSPLRPETGQPRNLSPVSQRARVRSTTKPVANEQ